MPSAIKTHAAELPETFTHKLRQSRAAAEPSVAPLVHVVSAEHDGGGDDEQ